MQLKGIRMQHRNAHRVFSLFMAFALVLTCNSATFQPLMALADDAPASDAPLAATDGEGGGTSAGDLLQSESPSIPSDAGASGSATSSGSGGGSGDASDGAAPNGDGDASGLPTPRDLAEDADALGLVFVGASYVDANGEWVLVEAEDGRADVSGADAAAATGWELVYRATVDPVAAAAGDYFTLVAPPAPLSLASEDALAEANADVAELAALSLVEGAVRVEPTEEALAAAEPFELDVRVPVELAAADLAGEPSEVALALQGDEAATLVLPAKPAPETSDASASLAASANALAANGATVTLGKEWRDNNDVGRPWEKIATDGTLGVWFSIDGGTETLLTVDTKDQVGITGDIPSITATPNGTSHTDYTCTGLPSTVKVGGTSKPITYTIKEGPDKALGHGYVQQFDADNQLYNVKTTEFTAKVTVRDGGKHDDPEPVGKFQLYNAPDSDSPIEGFESTWEFNNNDGTGTYTALNLPMYDLDGKPITYCAKAPDAPDEPTEDYYYPEYDNAAVVNHGTNVTECYDGGTINLTLAGEAVYTGTKAWLDDHAQAEDRPDAAFYLWRYTDKGNNSFKEAAQVRDDNNTPIEVKLTGDDKGYDTFGFMVKGDKSPDSTLQSLPKYDAEGYPYVYLTRETLSGGACSYEQVFGEVHENGTVRDTAPDSRDGWTRDGADRSLYNGGTLSNRRTGTTSTSSMKTWKASVYQNQIANAKVTMTLQSRPKGTGEGDWTNTITSQVLTDFKAEIMTRTAEASATLYDALGRELEYRWMETSVKEGDGDEELLQSDGTFQLACSKATSEADENAPEHFASSVEPINPNDPDQGTWVVNRIAGTVDYTIDKVWKDASGNTVAAPEGASITVGIYQNGKAMADRVYTLNGTVHDRETSPWHLYVNDLPKYDDEGRLYTYVAEEVKGYDGYFSDYVYDIAKRTTTITNTPGVRGNLIRVQKEWIDDSDVDHRYPVTVQVHKKNADGSAGDAVGGPVILSPENNWWEWVSVPEGTGIDDYVLEETALTKSQTEVYVPNTADYNGLLTVTTDKHIYQVTSGANKELNMLTVTNKRIGVIDLTVTKKWVDVGNETNRPGAKLQLKCLEYPDAVQTGSIVLPDSNSLPILDKEGKQTTSSQQVNAAQDATESTYTFFNLPKYDATGKVIHYAVEENPDDASAFAGADYHAFVTQTGYEVGTVTHTHDQQAIEVTNQRSGTKDVLIHKRWRDAYAYQNGKRPDIYLTLWQKTDATDASLVGGTGFKECQWSARVNGDGSVIDADNEWTATFSGMPKYDAAGAAITYYAQEAMQSNAAAFDYTPVTFGDGDEVIAVGGLTGKDALKEGGTFVNAIENNVVIEGKKFWKNMPAGFPSAQLPKLTVYLDQYLGEGKITENIATLTGLTTPESTNDFTFDISKAGTNNPDSGASLPKYDDKGELYAYQVRETIEGTPADSGTWAQIYPPQPSVALTLENVFNTSDGNVGGLKVTKEWKDHPDGKPYPAATFTLHRTYAKADKSTVDEAVAEKVLGNAESVKGITEVTFENLLVYAPDGQKYQYYVEEAAVVGYKTTGSPTNSTALTANATTDAGTIINTYENMGSVVLKVTKEWNDYADAFGLRPADLELTLERMAPAQLGQDNAIGWETVPVSEINIEWDRSDDKAWTFTIRDADGYAPLARYAPNGMPWTYKVEETAPNDYVATTQNVQKSASEADKDGVVTFDPLKNKLDTRAQVEKNWDDGDNAYGMRPASVTVKLQVSTDSGSTWTDASTALGSSMPDYAFEKKLESPWSDTFDNLPAGKTSGGTTVTYQYRVVETQIGTDEHEKLSVGNDGTYTYVTSGNHAYEVSGSVSGSTTTITNKLTDKGTSLKVIKTWHDQDNFYKTRLGSNPSIWEIQVQLQSSTTGEESSWSDIGDKRTIKESGTPTMVTYESLPKYDSSGNPYYYRAKETVPVGYTVDAETKSVTGGFETTLTNTLETTSLTGTKTWSASPHPDSVQLDLYREVPGITALEKVEVPDGQPKWTNKSAEGDKWTYEYTGLPVHYTDILLYRYSVKERTVPEGWWVSYFDGSTNVVNTQTSYTIWKHDAGGYLIEGSTFEVTGVFAGKTEKETREVKPSASPEARLGEMIAGNTYTVTETTPPPGYAARPAFQVKMGEDGNLVKVGTWPETVGIRDGNTIVVQDVKTDLTIAKKNQFGENVPGAILELRGVFADSRTSISWITAGSDPFWLLGKLVAGNEYVLSETMTPDGYLPAESQTIRVAPLGQLQVRSGQEGSYEWRNVEGNAFTFVNQRSLTQAKLTKIGADGKPLEGTTFSLYKKGAGQNGGDLLIRKNIKPMGAGAEAVWTTASQPDTVKNHDTGQPLNKGLANGTYYFVETATGSDDYCLNPDHHEFTTDNATNETEVGTTVVNAKMNAAMTLHKVDVSAPSDPVAGVTFKLEYQPASGGTAVEKTLTTDESGDIFAPSLAKGTYTLTETDATDSYQNGGFKATFTVTDACQGKTLAINSDTVGDKTLFNLQIEADEDHLNSSSLSNERVLGSVDIEKQDADGKPLDGVTFELRGAGGTYVHQGTTADGGKLSFSNMPWGSYVLVETAVPDGYAKDAAGHEFTIGKGALTKSFTMAGDGAIVNKQNEFTVAKFDADGVGLEGATLTIGGKFVGGNSEETRELLVGKQSATWIGQLIGGHSYFIEETVPPAGYAICDAFTVAMGFDGTLSAEGDLPDGVSIEGNVVKVVDAQNKATFAKKNADGSVGVTGAQFSLKGTFAGEAAEKTEVWPTTAEAQPFEGKLVAGSEYVLTETAAAAGYVISPFTDSYADAAPADGSSLTVKMDSWGRLNYKTQDGGWNLVGGNAVAVKDAQNKLSLYKQDAVGAALAGAVFTIEGDIVNADGTVARQTIPLLNSADDRSASDGSVTGRLVAGRTYTVHEVTPPDGCTTVPDFQVKMNADGTIRPVGQLPAGVSVDSASAVVTVTDAPTKVGIAKMDQDGGTLAGAELSLEGTFADGTPSPYRWTSGKDAAEAFEGKLIAGETYTLTETSRLTGYFALPGAITFTVNGDGTLALKDHPRYEYGLGDSASVSTDGLALLVRNVKTAGEVELVKTSSGADAVPLDGVEFALYDGEGELIHDGLATGNAYDAQDWSAKAAEAGTLSVAGLDLGDYYLQETKADGYRMGGSKHPFTIGEEEAAGKAKVDLGTVTNDPIAFSFDKLELYAESCSDAGLGAEGADAVRALEGARFTAYEDEACTTVAKTVEGKDMAAVSDADGTVAFSLFNAGTYYVRETQVPDGRVSNGLTYRLDVAADGTVERFTPVGEDGVLAQVVNDVHRADIRIKKVADSDPTKTLPDSTYGLYKRLAVGAPEAFAYGGTPAVSADGLQLIAKATTGTDGFLVFKGVLMDQEYVVQELASPDGSLVSKNPIAITFAVDESGAVKIVSFDDGSGTAELDADGNIVWKEPQVLVRIDKKNPEGGLLEGAKLQVVDADGNVAVEPWTSASEGRVVEGVLAAGKTYRLQELEAPAGYAKADDVPFTVDDPKVAPDEDHTQLVEMIDQRIPAAAKGAMTRTGDPWASAGALAGGVLVAAAGVAGASVLRRRRRG